MLTFRIICAILVAWSTNWALGRPEAAALLQEIPEMRVFGPAAGAVIGFVNLASRQGWGFVVAVANGIWAGFLSLILAGFLYVSSTIYVAMRDGYLANFDNFLALVGEHGQDLIDQGLYPPLLVVSLAAAAVAGVATECAHWLLVRFREVRRRTGDTE